MILKTDEIKVNVMSEPALKFASTLDSGKMLVQDDVTGKVRSIDTPRQITLSHNPSIGDCQMKDGKVRASVNKIEADIEVINIYRPGR